MKRLGVLVCVFLLLGSAVASKKANALDRDVRAVMLISVYGMAGGTALGLISLPSHQSLRGVFMGTSVGLYVGILIGLYFIHNRDDPQNPLLAQAYPMRELGLLEREKFQTLLPEHPKAFEIQYPVMQF